jgi:hypothetical protein
MNNTQPGGGSEKPFYVGYLPLPTMLVPFLRAAVAVTLIAMGAAAVVVARSQPDPGSAVWDDSHAREFRGILITRPYLMLAVAPQSEAQPGNSAPIAGDRSSMFLLVEMGKHGARAGADSLAGKHVVVSGWTLERDGRRMIELEPDPTALRPDSSSRTVPVPPAAISKGAVSLTGEIVDSKCFLGAMKPGEGKSHKACATLCVRGGIPPVLVTRDSHGATSFYLLADPSGGPLDEQAWPLIADPVRVAGTLELIGDLRVLKVKPPDITRL